MAPFKAIGGAAKDSSQLGHLDIQEPAKPVRLKDQALLGEWQDIAFRLQKLLKAAITNDRPNDAKAYSIAAGVATDKLLVLAGRPTSIVAGLHEVRHSLPQLAATLTKVAEIINVESEKSNGFQETPSSPPVSDPAPHSTV